MFQSSKGHEIVSVQNTISYSFSVNECLQSNTKIRHSCLVLSTRLIKAIQFFVPIAFYTIFRDRPDSKQYRKGRFESYLDCIINRSGRVFFQLQTLTFSVAGPLTILHGLCAVTVTPIIFLVTMYPTEIVRS